jgi:hypothetical protein
LSSQIKLIDSTNSPTDYARHFGSGSFPRIPHVDTAHQRFRWNTPALSGGRYEDLMEDKPKSLAALLNITTAMQEIALHDGTPLDYLKQIIWDDTLAQDRFFGYCDVKLIDEVRLAASQENLLLSLLRGCCIPEPPRAGSRFSSARPTCSSPFTRATSR